ncbi:MAG: ABC transporter ATP-binding protein [Actinomycetota bacterium]|nr:ABC transporter ATP-binding protein [Actinomycetota bacterium]MDP9475035.1 ABC transporter ATP-binding protein [Actinomycetota bacterium]
MSAGLELRNLTHRYTQGSSAALSQLSVEVNPQELVAFLGPSGCGKTTALRIIAGLLRPTSGDVLVDGVSVLAVPPEKRGAAMVFQNPLLFPHMSVAANIGFGLRMRNVRRDQIERRIATALRQVRMEGFEDRRPDELSGGQQQRVALARALVTEPRLLLLDEPLSALDASLRDEMRELVREVQKQGGYTTVFVTHDQEEAVVLADRIALLFDGKLQMYDEPQAFYDRPASRRIAEFFGATNFIRGRVRNGAAETRLGRLNIAGVAPSGDVTLTIRPEAVRLEEGENSFPARITRVTYLGTRISCRLDANGLNLRVAVPPDARVHEGKKVTARLPTESLWALRD